MCRLARALSHTASWYFSYMRVSLTHRLSVKGIHGVIEKAHWNSHRNNAQLLHGQDGPCSAYVRSTISRYRYQSDCHLPYLGSWAFTSCASHGESQRHAQCIDIESASGDRLIGTDRWRNVTAASAHIITNKISQRRSMPVNLLRTRHPVLSRITGTFLCRRSSSEPFF
jgi:hypothetical protein